MLLVGLLRDTFSGLWNVIGGLGIIPGEWPLRHTVLRTSRLWVYQLRSFCVDRERLRNGSQVLRQLLRFEFGELLHIR